MRFVTRLNDGERMTDLCEEFGISRKTGYKLQARYAALGLAGLEDQSRAPKRVPHRTSEEVAALIVRARTRHPHWGGKKLREVLAKRYPDLTLPCPSTIDALIRRRGLVTPRRRGTGGAPAAGAPLHPAGAPNVVWCTDYKGEFRTGDGKYCYPLTITDRFSRSLLCCEGFERIDTDAAMASFRAVFAEFGLPEVMRSDNGVPFATNGLWGLSRLSVWWLRLGIRPERIAPGQPQQNGQHERMHREIKRATTRPAAAHLLAQQERFDAFVEEYNTVRPHEALGMRTPAQLYTPSPRRMPDRLAEPTYPLHDDVARVDVNGHVRLARRNVLLCRALAGQLVGLREGDDGTWLLSFLHYDLGTWRPGEDFVPYLQLRAA